MSQRLVQIDASGIKAGDIISESLTGTHRGALRPHRVVTIGPRVPFFGSKMSGAYVATLVPILKARVIHGDGTEIDTTEAKVVTRLIDSSATFTLYID